VQLIKKFDPWRSKLCTCPHKFSLSGYTGCGHYCLYCYASSYIKDFFSPRVKKNFLRRVRSDLAKVEEGVLISLSNSSDPYQPLERTEMLTRGFLLICKDYKVRILLVTKSDLILRDIDVLKKLNVVCCISITTLNDKLSRILEKGAPLPWRRIKAVKELAKYNIPVAIRFDPLIYPLNTSRFSETVRIFKKAGARQLIVSTYKVRPDNFRRMTQIFPQYRRLWRRMYFKEGEKNEGYYYLNSDVRKKIILQVREISLKNKLLFSSCREGFSSLNTGICDGSSLFR